jgi:phosphoribosylformimino-5-aminoimidazole carboxamide ribotide isomerase
VAVLIPSIDLMGGKIVQLVQGEKKALEFDDFEPWIERFSRYPVVQVIDLDAAKRVGSNRPLVEMLASRLPCQVGGGIHTVAGAQDLLRAGARKVIFGSALLHAGEPNVAFAREAAAALGAERLVFAIDSRGGKIAVRGWQETTPTTALDMIRALEPYCDAFLYTHIDTEGTLSGLPLDAVRALRGVTTRKLIAAGGIRSMEEVEALDAIGVDAVVGMAIYTERIRA